MTNQKKPTALLSEEHKNVLQKLADLEKVISQLEKREEISTKLKELADFFKTDFWLHFTKEENALFPEIEKFLPRESGPLGVMLMEHEDLRKINTELQRAVDTYFRDADNDGTKAMIRRQGNLFIEILRGHIDKEDNILFMIADMHLDQHQMDKVLTLFQEIERSGAKIAN